MNPSSSRPFCLKGEALTCGLLCGAASGVRVTAGSPLNAPIASRRRIRSRSALLLTLPPLHSHTTQSYPLTMKSVQIILALLAMVMVTEAFAPTMFFDKFKKPAPKPVEAAKPVRSG